MLAGPSQAQLAGDGSVGTQVNGSEVNACVGGPCVITGGTLVGDNLFHSFREFSLLSGSSAVFDNGSASNIFSRVTGGAPSLIDGLISASNANLFLINPNGLTFGSNAALAIGGSFVGSTAENILFDNGAQFSSQNTPLTSGLLTVTAPIGLQTGSSPGSIQVQGQGNNLFVNPQNFEVVRDFRSPGLAVTPTQTLALIGGDLSFQGGNLTAVEGNIELGSLGPDSSVSIASAPTGWRFNYGSTGAFGDIQLSQASSLDTSGNGGGSIHVRGRGVSLNDGSALLSNTLGTTAGRNIVVEADSLNIAGVSPLAPFVSSIFADAASTATAPGGVVILDVDRLTISSGGQVGASTFGSANAGRVEVIDGEVDIRGGSPLGPSGLFSIVAPNALGDGGDVIIEADSLFVADGAQVSVTSEGFGRTGNLRVDADSVVLSGFLVTPNAVFASALAANVGPDSAGAGGSINLDVNSLEIRNGAQLSSGTFGAGNASNVQITASDIRLIGDPQLTSGIFAPVGFAAVGNGGDITVKTNRLQAIDGAQIATSTVGFGDAGRLQVEATDAVELVGQSVSGAPSGLFASSLGFPGAGGDLIVNAGRLAIRDGASVSVRSASTGPGGIPSPFPSGGAGNIRATAAVILLDNQGSLSAETESGDRGNIQLTTDLLSLRRGSQVTTDAQRNASGGNIFIDARNGLIVAVDNENSDISANAVFGSGGRVDIITQGLIGIQPRSVPTALSDITASSEFGLDGSISVNTVSADPATEASNVPSPPAEPPLLRGCQASGISSSSRFIQAGRGGLISHPYESLGASNVLGDVQPPRDWRPEATVRIEDTSEMDSPQAPPIQEARGWRLDEQGTLILLAERLTSAELRDCQYQPPALSTESSE
ncbi:filamentous hemagglutinin [filamentous cyanobacterium CCP5]|nr:filamentous hemagglutinin [filamentous cyanobacterium CCP5]